MPCSRAYASARSADRDATATNSPWPLPSSAPLMSAVESSPQRSVTSTSASIVESAEGPRAESGLRAGPPASRSSRLGASAPGERVDRHRGQEDQAGDDELRARAQPEEAEPVVDRRDDERAEHGRLDVAAAAEQRRAADDGRRDRVQQDGAAARVRVDRAQARGEHDAAERRHHRADPEAGDLDVVDVDARAPGRLGVAADGVDVAAEPGPVEHERPQDVQGRDHEEHVGDPAVRVGERDHDDAGRRQPEDAQREQQRRLGRQAGLAPRAVRVEQDARVERDAQREHDPRGHVGQEVVREADDDAVLDDDGALVPDEQEHHAVPGEQAGQRDDERRHADLRDDQPLEDPDREARGERDEDRGPGAQLVVAVGDQEQRRRHAGDAADVADGQVDLAQQQDEDDPHPDDGDRRHLDDEVDEVPRGQEPVVLGLEDDRDQEQADDDRQRAELAGADAGPPAPREVAERLVGSTRDSGGCGVRGIDRGSRAHAGTSAWTWPGTLDSAPAVIASTTWVWVTSVRLYSATFCPRRSTVMVSATSKMSCRLWEISTTARPCSPRRRTRSSTCRVCATPSAAVGSSRMTTLEFHMTALATATDWRWPPDSPATVWRTERIVVTDSDARVSLARFSMRVSSRRRSDDSSSRPRNMFW